ncbi:sensor histidine kinase [Paenibacillus eucommiae]|uniref:histidine kinase n=1 Tax=Paenibacillus eucommiae TaxID=1355755 RepID=A0ABS4IZZ2_9BACL|nr:histidine kinase [Paenibacillus eucommiae]MBP1993158.1 two-component system sensor histidine kinase YesM [Paenibacillus eucommiae]
MMKRFEEAVSRLRPYLFYTLRSRVIAILLLSSLVPLVLIGGVSYYMIASMLNNKVMNGVRSQLEQTAFSLDKEIQSLNHVAMQLSFEGGVGLDFKAYLSSADFYEQYMLEQSIQNYIDLITYTSPNIGLVHYYFSDTRKNAFRSNDMTSDFYPDKLPKLYSFSGITYHAIHKSFKLGVDSLVLSVDRRIFIPEYGTLHVYVETNPQLVSHILGTGQSGMETAYLMTDEHNRIVYSEKEDEFAIGQELSDKQSDGARSGYLFTEKAGDWTWAAIISKQDFDKEKYSWLRNFVIFGTVSLAVALGFASILWRTVYKPLAGFNKEIRLLQNNGGFHSILKYPRIAEFDYVLNRFDEMRQRIWRLLQEARRNEKLRAELEVEKLMVQINPHFIHNTLDTVRWLARLNSQDEIERLVATLNKVLYYNMGKGGTATIGQEIALLNDYVTLQQIRYDFRFEIGIKAEDDLMDVPIPRFILQPLVENSLYHGLGDEGKIEVKAAFDEDKHIRIEVNDNGAGMSEEEIRQLFEPETGNRKKKGMGIGIGYVRRVIAARYGDDASLDIRSKPGEGTSIVLCIPIEVEQTGE